MAVVCAGLALGAAAAAILPANAREASGQQASAQQADRQQADATREAGYLSGNCTTCHGFGGRPAGDAIPELAGRPAARLVEQLREYREGTREGTIMNQIAKGYTDAQIEALARYFSAQEVSK
ncbi:MAG: c-type cytochrome [Gammaproteobacteria bacterium]